MKWKGSHKTTHRMSFYVKKKYSYVHTVKKKWDAHQLIKVVFEFSKYVSPPPKLIKMVDKNRWFIKKQNYETITHWIQQKGAQHLRPLQCVCVWRGRKTDPSPGGRLRPSSVSKPPTEAAPKAEPRSTSWAMVEIKTFQTNSLQDEFCCSGDGRAGLPEWDARELPHGPAGPWHRKQAGGCCLGLTWALVENAESQAQPGPPES